MTEHSWFFDGVASEVNEAEWIKFGQYFMSNGVIYDADTNFGLNKMEPYASGADANVHVKSGRAYNHGHAYESDAEFVQAISANATGSTRVDRIVLRANRTTNTVVLTYLNTGQPSAGQPPPLSNTATIVDLPVCKITADASFTTIAAAKVTDERLVSVGIDGVDGAMIKLFDTTLSADAASLDLQNIPPSFADLLVIIKAQGATAVANIQAILRVNNDSGNNYDFQENVLKGAVATPGRSTTSRLILGDMSAASSAITSQWLDAEAKIFDYASANQKGMSAHAVAYDNATSPYQFIYDNATTWRSTAVINRATLSVNGGTNLKAGSRMRVFGIR